MQFLLSGWLYANYDFDASEPDSSRSDMEEASTSHAAYPPDIQILLLSSFLLFCASFYYYNLLSFTFRQHLKSSTGEVEDTSDEEEDWELEMRKYDHRLKKAYLPPIMDSAGHVGGNGGNAAGGGNYAPGNVAGKMMKSVLATSPGERRDGSARRSPGGAGAEGEDKEGSNVANHAWSARLLEDLRIYDFLKLYE
eukprot:g7975.t1